MRRLIGTSGDVIYVRYVPIKRFPIIRSKSIDIFLFCSSHFGTIKRCLKNAEYAVLNIYKSRYTALKFFPPCFCLLVCLSALFRDTQMCAGLMKTCLNALQAYIFHYFFLITNVVFFKGKIKKSCTRELIMWKNRSEW